MLMACEGRRDQFGVLKHRIDCLAAMNRAALVQRRTHQHFDKFLRCRVTFTLVCHAHDCASHLKLSHGLVYPTLGERSCFTFILANPSSDGYDVSCDRIQVILKGIHMPSNEPTPAQIDLIRNLVRSVTTENAQAEYEKARLQFTSKEEFQAALKYVEFEIQHHLTLIEHWHHMSNQ
jgi:hypothetical protein